MWRWSGRGCIGPNDRTRRLEALPSHATAICGLVRGVLCSFRLHTVDLWIGRLDDAAREVDGVHCHGAGACAIGPDVVTPGRRGSSCLDRFRRFCVAGGEVGGTGISPSAVRVAASETRKIGARAM